MQWSKERPTSVGFYWFKGTLDGQSRFDELSFDVPTILELTVGDEGAVFFKVSGQQWWRHIESTDGEWAGPLQYPAE